MGQQYLGYTFIGKSETQWYYDSGNSLLYIHFQVGSPVGISLNGAVTTTGTTTVTTTSCTSSNIIIGAVTSTTTVYADCTTNIPFPFTFDMTTLEVLMIFTVVASLIIVRSRRKE